MAIRYDKKFNAEIRSTIRRYNSKIRRLEKSNKTGVYIPEKVDLAMLNEMKAKSTTRKDIRRQLKGLENFIKRGGEQYVSVDNNQLPRSLYETAKSLNRSIIGKISRELKTLTTEKPKVLGKEQDITFAQMADRRYLNLTAKQTRIKTGTELKNLSVGDLEVYINFLTSNLKTTDIKTWQNNYLEILTDTAYTYGVPHSEVHYLREKLQNLTPSQFDKIFNQDKALQQIIYYYHSVEDLGIDVAYETGSDDVRQLFDSLLENINAILNE